MSFICNDCKTQQPNKTKPVKVIKQRRDKLYPNGGRGWEIVRVADCCKPCSLNTPQVSR